MKKQICRLVLLCTALAALLLCGAAFERLLAPISVAFSLCLLLGGCELFCRVLLWEPSTPMRQPAFFVVAGGRHEKSGHVA